MRSLLVHLYPASWRDRYGAEFSALIEAMPLTPLAFTDVARAALGMRVLALLRSLNLVPGGSGVGASRSALAAALLLIPSAAMLGVIALRFTFGVNGPFDALWFGTPLLTRYFVLLLPALSLAAASLPLISLTTTRAEGDGTWVALRIRIDRSNIAIGILSACVLGAMLRYFLLRHLLTLPY